jgi:2-keto-4-pentenoate hydratase/2-oxohepta-3-ene-1,7-dioic acid hydratase in catechol pathway
MKIARIRTAQGVRPALQGEDRLWRDAESIVGDWTPDTIGTAEWETCRNQLAALPLIHHPHFEAPISRPGKIVCIGLNFTDHAREAEMAVPSEPVFFLKAPTSWCGPDADVWMPPGAEKLDWEIELAIVIGRHARHLPAARAMEAVLGYTIMNDVSERAYQLERNGQWTKGKSYDRFAPAGPFIAMRDEVEDVNKLSMTLEVNGAVRQQGSTANMIFDVATVVSYVSQFMTLEPGDVISTGTPAGVGLGHKPPQFLKAGDVMTLRIDGLGQQRQRVTLGETR